MKDNSNKNFWNKVSSLYTRFMKNNDKAYKESCKHISTFLKPNMKVLELACGTGQFTALLHKQASEWIATDFSEGMIEIAKKEYKNKNIIFVVQDATSITYAENRFDAVLIANALHVMPTPEKVLDEIRRILKPNGILIAPTFIYDEHVPKIRMWLLEKIGFRTFGKWTSEELTNLVSQNGFSVVSKLVVKSKPLSECVLIAHKK